MPPIVESLEGFVKSYKVTELVVVLYNTVSYFASLKFVKFWEVFTVLNKVLRTTFDFNIVDLSNDSILY